MNKSDIHLGLSADIMINLIDQEEEIWSPCDLQEILDHVLQASVREEIFAVSELIGLSKQEQALLDSEVGDESFEKLLFGADVSSAALTIVKNFGKRSMAKGESLPRDVARVIYVLAIVKAMSVAGQKISALHDEVVVREARRCLTFPWLPDRVRSHMSELAAFE